MRISITLFFGLVGVALGYTADRSPQKFTQEEQPDYDYESELAPSSQAADGSFYDSDENYHTSGDSEEYTDGSPEQSPEKSHNDSPKWNGPLAEPPGYEPNGQPQPVQDLPAVVAEKQKHLHLFSYGPHAGAVAAQPYLKPVHGGYSSPWVPIIVPLHHQHHQHQHQQHHGPHQPLQQQFHYQNIHYQG